MELMFGNACLSWIWKTLTLQYMCILVGLSQFDGLFSSWFCFVLKIFGENGQNWSIFCL